MNYRKRNKLILAMRSGGMTYAAIGRHFNLTRQRVQQITSTAPWEPEKPAAYYGQVIWNGRVKRIRLK